MARLREEDGSVIDFIKEKEKRDAIKYIEEQYKKADDQFYIDKDGNVVYYDSEGNKYIHTYNYEI
jgi:hypothetical protein